MDLMTRRRALLARVESGGVRLPDEYQEVEYIETNASTAYAYLYIPQSYADFSKSTVYMQIEYLQNISSESAFFGLTFVYELAIVNNKIQHFYTDGIQLVSPAYNTQVSPNTKIDVVANIVTSRDGKKGIFVYRENMYKFTGRLYYFYVIKDGIKIIDLVPCVRKADDVPGAYDLVNGGFFQSATNAPFIVPI